MKTSRTFGYTLLAVALLGSLALLRQRRRPIPHPPPLIFLLEDPIVGVIVGPELLI